MNKRPLVVAGLLLSALAPPCLAAEGGDAGCSRIADVDLPYDVGVAADALRFEGRDGTIVVTPDRIESGNQVFRDEAVRGYHDDLRGFLDNAGSMAKVAKAFTRRDAFPQAATGMCRAILAVQASGAEMEQRFPGFTSPVRVSLE
ncbi:hypothetical protein ACFONC_10570 [Luteimonas soli]|uniref:DUF2884 family protein n=1 Tax=Luteimonas soli TaxID=1648966 RepID=A0ABV7XKA6_9GAMM